MWGDEGESLWQMKDILWVSQTLLATKIRYVDCVLIAQDGRVWLDVD